MEPKQEILILESLFIIIKSIDPRRLQGTELNPIGAIFDQKSKINDRLVELQKGEKDLSPF